MKAVVNVVDFNAVAVVLEDVAVSVLSVLWLQRMLMLMLLL